jgi:hypothetical protein
MSAETFNHEKLYFLAKFNNPVVLIDIKCRSTSKEASIELVELVSLSLNELSL